MKKSLVLISASMLILTACSPNNINGPFTDSWQTYQIEMMEGVDQFKMNESASGEPFHFPFMFLPGIDTFKFRIGAGEFFDAQEIVILRAPDGKVEDVENYIDLLVKVDPDDPDVNYHRIESDYIMDTLYDYVDGMRSQDGVVLVEDQWDVVQKSYNATYSIFVLVGIMYFMDTIYDDPDTGLPTSKNMNFFALATLAQKIDLPDPGEIIGNVLDNLPDEEFSHSDKTTIEDALGEEIGNTVPPSIFPDPIVTPGEDGDSLDIVNEIPEEYQDEIIDIINDFGDDYDEELANAKELVLDKYAEGLLENGYSYLGIEADNTGPNGEAIRVYSREFGPQFSICRIYISDDLRFVTNFTIAVGVPTVIVS